MGTQAKSAANGHWQGASTSLKRGRAEEVLRRKASRRAAGSRGGRMEARRARSRGARGLSTFRWQRERRSNYSSSRVVSRGLTRCALASSRARSASLVAFENFTRSFFNLARRARRRRISRVRSIEAMSWSQNLEETPAKHRPLATTPSNTRNRKTGTESLSGRPIRVKSGSTPRSPPPGRPPSNSPACIRCFADEIDRFVAFCLCIVNAYACVWSRGVPPCGGG